MRAHFGQLKLECCRTADVKMGVNYTRLDKARDIHIRQTMQVTHIKDTVREGRLRCFGIVF